MSVIGFWLEMQFLKYHALGNDYLVYAPSEDQKPFTGKGITKICHRNYGLGSDGILWGPIKSSEADFALRIFNPDGSEAEKSGNGLRIFCRYLFDQGLVDEDKVFTIETLGGVVEARILEKGTQVEVEMGKPVFEPARIPVNVENSESELLRYPLEIDGRHYEINTVSVGNPHCVILMDQHSEALARQLGPKIECHPMFPARINMQLLKIIDRANIQIEIWERGAGYTLASGTSSCAASVVANRLGYCDGSITVHSPGGKLSIEIQDDAMIKMTGPVTPVGRFEMRDEVVSQQVPGI